MKRTLTAGEELVAEYVVFATFGLIAPARERIRGEIESHYADGLDRRLRDGWEREDAGVAAALELGDPKSALAAYRKRHLTEEECSWLVEYEGRWKPRRGLRPAIWAVLGILATVLLLTTLIFWRFAGRSTPDVQMAAKLSLVAGWVVTIVSSGALLRSLHLTHSLPSGPALWRRLMVLNLLNLEAWWGFTVFGGIFPLIVALHWPVFPAFLGWVLSPLGLVFTQPFRLRRKLSLKQQVGAGKATA